ncbi:MAG: Nicotinamide-nucleotide adenylyltransferase [Candidatus Heimdallarchaeota archaeon LC_3]|nr:MAG: Nicotinamide-nucleotide adenylyltransferase [Candidatus Heimdallarchaeota archaeon LC_3]
MVRALYIGRFNPPHKGHLEALKYIFSIDDIDSIIIGIGSAQASYSIENPLTGGERFEILTKLFENYEKIENKLYYIIPLLDINNNNLFVSQVSSICPSFNFVFSNNPLVQLIFTRAGFKVQEIPLIKRDNYSGSIIREKMINNEGWENLVPRISLDLLKKYKIVERLKILKEKDK